MRYLSAQQFYIYELV